MGNAIKKLKFMLFSRVENLKRLIDFLNKCFRCKIILNEIFIIS